MSVERRRREAQDSVAWLGDRGFVFPIKLKDQTGGAGHAAHSAAHCEIIYARLGLRGVGGIEAMTEAVLEWLDPHAYGEPPQWLVEETRQLLAAISRL